MPLMLVDLVADVEWDLGSKVHKVGTRSLDRSWSPLMDWCHGRLPNLANFHSSWWIDDDEKTSWGLQYSGKTTPQSIEKDLSEFGGKLKSHGERGGRTCWASIEGIWPGGRGNWSIKEGTDAESGRGQNFGLQKLGRECRGSVTRGWREQIAYKSLTSSTFVRDFLHLCS